MVARAPASTAPRAVRSAARAMAEVSRRGARGGDATRGAAAGGADAAGLATTGGGSSTTGDGGGGDGGGSSTSGARRRVHRAAPSGAAFFDMSRRRRRESPGLGDVDRAAHPPRRIVVGHDRGVELHPIPPGFVAGWGRAPRPHGPPAPSADATNRQVTEVDTIEPMVSPGPGATEAPPVRSRPWLFRLAIVFLVVVSLGLASTFFHLPYDAISPGTATPVTDYILAPKGSTFPPKGKMFLLTVSFREGISPIDYLMSSIDGDTQVVKKKVIDSGVPKGQTQAQYNRQLMDDSEQKAVVVALRKLGYPVAETGDGAFVIDVAKTGPSVGHLNAGDTITSVGGVPVHTLDQATTTIRSHHPGDTIAVTVHPARGADRTEQLTVGHRVAAKNGPTCTTAADPTATDACLGVIIQTHNQNFRLPLKVKIDAGGIGGPSAGLSFTLGVLDELTAGDLTGGQKVAVTGTIEVDGSVGAVGGVRQKTAAAIAAGARYMLVPPDEPGFPEYSEALARAKGHNLTVIKVSTLDEALRCSGPPRRRRLWRGSPGCIRAVAVALGRHGRSPRQERGGIVR